jgi:hypothetical protein
MKNTLIFSGLNTFCRFKAITYDCRRPIIYFRKVFTEINENLENRYLIRYIEYVSTVFEPFSQFAFLLNSGLLRFNSSSTESRPFFQSLCTTKAPFQILCVNFSTQTQMTVMRNDSADDLARLNVANLYCANHFRLLIPT